MKAVGNGLLLLSILFLASPGLLWGQSNDDCLACHSEPSLTAQEKGRRSTSSSTKTYSSNPPTNH